MSVLCLRTQTWSLLPLTSSRAASPTGDPNSAVMATVRYFIEAHEDCAAFDFVILDLKRTSHTCHS